MRNSILRVSALVAAASIFSSPTLAQGDRELIRELEFLPPDLRIAAINDFDGDGYRDLLGGNPDASAGGLQAGRVQILSGLDGTPLFTLEGSADDELGYAVTALARIIHKEVGGRGSHCRLDVYIGIHSANKPRSLAQSYLSLGSI